MTATVAVQVATGSTDGGTPTETTVTAIRFKDGDSAVIDANNPIVIPAASVKYSYWKSVFLDLSSTFTTINNVKHYTDGTIGWTLGTNGEARRGNRDAGDKGAGSFADYRVADGLYDIAQSSPNGHEFYNAQTTKTALLSADTSGSPATIDSTDHSGAGNTKHVVMQIKVDNDATQGAQASETFTWLYDEI